MILHVHEAPERIAHGGLPEVGLKGVRMEALSLRRAFLWAT